MRGRRFWIIAGVGCAILIVLLVVVIPLAFMSMSSFRISGSNTAVVQVAETIAPGAEATQALVPTLTVPSNGALPGASESLVGAVDLEALYAQVNPGVVNIQVLVEQGGNIGEGAGSGFILDTDGHIITNNHVVSGAADITVVFFDGFEEAAKVIGVDRDSDLAVIQVADMPPNVHPLPLSNSDEVKVGEWVVAIGNPFGLGSSMSTGIVSAVGRTIASGATPFSIPQAIQTDAAINPGNSGGPLLNLNGEIIGVNAQIATQGSVAANVGVGFAIPSNVVRTVAPVLIRTGSYQWPWLGVRGTSVNLLLQEANNLSTQDGAYIVEVVQGGPSEKAGLKGATGTVSVSGFDVPSGGDVIIGVDGQPVQKYNDLLAYISFRDPTATVELTILRGGQQQQLTVQLQPRPANLSDLNQ